MSLDWILALAGQILALLIVTVGLAITLYPAGAAKT